MLKPFTLSALAALAAATGASDEAARAAAGPKTTAINMATTANTVISAQWNGFIGWLPSGLPKQALCSKVNDDFSRYAHACACLFDSLS
jgi:hypothetical protein